MPAKTETLPALPAISRELFDSLKADIERRGILVPLMDSTGPKPASTAGSG